MVKTGIVVKYNGRYGYIISEDNEKAEFSNKDISFKADLRVNDLVEYREEVKDKELVLARNIKRLDK